MFICDAFRTKSKVHNKGCYEQSIGSKMMRSSKFLLTGLRLPDSVFIILIIIGWIPPNIVWIDW